MPGSPFPFHRNVARQSNQSNRKHVFRDLRPYVCLSEGCQTPDHLYMRRNDWKMHMRREHWKTWHCPFGCDAEFDCAKGFQSHVKTAHEQNVSLEKIQALEGLSSRGDVAKAKGQCPLCHDFQIGSEKQYEKHVGQHLEHLALFTLPDTGEEADEDDEGDEENEEERLDEGDENNEDEDEEDEDEDWFATDDLGDKAADERWKPAAPPFRDSGRSSISFASIRSVYDRGVVTHTAFPSKEDVEMPAAVAGAKEAAERVADEPKEKIREETKAKLEESEKAEQAPIRFKDAVGRHFAFPFQLCATWQVWTKWILLDD